MLHEWRNSITIGSAPPELLQNMTGITSESKYFLQSMRAYNAWFQLTAFSATYMRSEDQFKSEFSIKGRDYQKVGSLLPFPNECHKFLQVYFTGDEQTEVNQRCKNFCGLRR